MNSAIFYAAQTGTAKVNFNGVTCTYLQGGVVGILDSAGNLAVEYRYDARARRLLLMDHLLIPLVNAIPSAYDAAIDFYVVQ